MVKNRSLYLLGDFLIKFAKPFKPPTLAELRPIATQGLSFVKRHRLRVKRNTDSTAFIHDAMHSVGGTRAVIIPPTPKAIKVAARKIRQSSDLMEKGYSSGIGSHGLSKGTKAMGTRYDLYLDRAQRPHQASILSARKHLNKSLNNRNYRAESYVAGLQGIKLKDDTYELKYLMHDDAARTKAYWLGRRARKKKAVPQAIMRMQAYARLNPAAADRLSAKAVASARKTKAVRSVRPLGASPARRRSRKKR